MNARQVYDKWRGHLKQMQWIWSPESKMRVSEILDDLKAVPAIDCKVTCVPASSGDDYFTTLVCGVRETQVYCFKFRYKAQYEADYLAWVFGLRDDEPDLMSYDETTYPNDRRKK